MPAPTNALAPQPNQAPAQQQPSNFLRDLYQQNVDMRARTYGESLLKSFTGGTNKLISTQDFAPQELAALDKLVNEHYAERMAYFKRPKPALLKDASNLDMQARQDLLRAQDRLAKDKTPWGQKLANAYTESATLASTKAKQLREAASGKIPTDFTFGYSGYGDENASAGQSTKKPAGWEETLGQFRYKVNPATGTYEAYDRYDFNNPAHAKSNEFFASLSPPVRLAKSLADTLTGDKYALGEAYLSGENSIPVNIKGKLK